MDLTCKEAEKLITQFMEKQLNPNQLKLYCDHVKKCKQCREDLEINYLVQECLKPDTELTTYNLQGQLEQKLQDAEHYVRQVQIHRVIYIVITILAGLGLSCVLLIRFVELLSRLF